MRRLSAARLPLRVRLVAGFAGAMLLVLAAAGVFVYLRVQYALDLRLDEDLNARSQQLTSQLQTGTSPAELARTTPGLAGGFLQILDASNHVLAASPGLPASSVLDTQELTQALRAPLRRDRGGLFPINNRTLRLYAVALRHGAPPGAGQPAVTVVAVRRDQRDEALRELIGQLALANLAALAIASLVGYRLARAALAPVERYRVRAAAIAAGATGVRLAVPARSHDEVARLGHTLNDMLTALETALEREKRFINDASHELRTPLTLLAAELELARRRPRSTAELDQTIRAAAADTAHLITLADTLLAVGVQPEQDASAPRVDISALLTNLLDRHGASTGMRGAIDPGLTVRGDENRLRRAVTNLLDNATRHGAPPVTLMANRTGDRIVVSVHDDGAGMAPNFLPHATQRFTRADTARTTPGTGLGLSLAEAVIHAHHGHLRVCSRAAHHHPDHLDIPCEHGATGTTLTLLLPPSD